jgi:hypothetical protein
MSGFNFPATTEQHTDDYGSWLGRKTKAGGYSPLFWRWGKVLPLLEYATLCHLLAVGRCQPRRNGWIPVSSEFLMAIGLTHKEQAAIVNSLRDKALIERKVMEGQRYLRVNLKNLDLLLNEPYATR